MKKFFLSVAAGFVLFAGNFTGTSVDENFFAQKVSAAWYDEAKVYDGDNYNPPATKDLSAGNHEQFAVEVLNLVNIERAKVGAPPLKLANDLQQEAAIRAREIVQHFSHTRPDGSDCFTVMRNRGNTCGENIAAGHATAAETVEQWMNSEGHRENILNSAYRELGVGYAYEDYSTYHHYWVQLFRG